MSDKVVTKTVVETEDVILGTDDIFTAPEMIVPIFGEIQGIRPVKVGNGQVYLRIRIKDVPEKFKDQIFTIWENIGLAPRIKDQEVHLYVPNHVNGGKVTVFKKLGYIILKWEYPDAGVDLEIEEL